MAWDKAKPAGSQKIRLSDEEIRANWTALEAALAKEHYFPNTGYDGVHKFPVEAAAPTGYEGRAAIVNDIWQFYSNGTWRAAQDFPSGTKMVFCQAAAPTGWTQDTTHNDKALRIVSGSGGGSGGSLALSSTVTGGHALAEGEEPPYTLSIKNTAVPPGQGDAFYNIGWGGASGGGEHTHPLALAYVDVIVAEKD